MVKTAFVTVTVAVLLAFSPAIATAPRPQSQIALNNDSVQVLVLAFPPGAGTGRHTGVEGELGILVEGELILESAKGRDNVRSGSVYWVSAGTPHDVRNESDRPAKLWGVLLKRCP
jgi:quercetin dioxygenase-like cupin family protein